jgi:hypothetical protein
LEADGCRRGKSAALTEIGSIFIGNNPITDAGLMRLTPLSELWEVVLGQTNVTDEGIESFRKAKPKCQVIR